MTKFKKSLAFVVALLTLSLAFPLNVVHAATKGGTLICTLFPFINQMGTFGISALCGKSTDTAGDIKSILTLVVSLIFIAIIIFAIYVIIKSAIKYIRSEGDEAKIQEATKAIKSVFIGIGALFVGLIGLVIILAFFNAQNALNNDINTTNLNSPLLNNLFL